MQVRNVVVATVVAVGALTAAAGSSSAAAPKPADVTVKVLASSSDAYVAGKIVYNVLATNLGGADTANVTVDATIGGNGNAAALTVTQSLGTCAIAEPTHVSCSIPVLAHGTTAKIRVQVKPNLPGNVDFSATISASADANPTNDSATATAVVHPGKPGPPEVRMSGQPKGATSDPKRHTATVRVKVDVSEPGTLTVQVVDRTLGTSIALLPGSIVGTTRLRVRQATVTAPVGDAATVHNTHLVYEIRLPLAQLRPSHAYALVVEAVDLEGQQGDALQIPFRLRKPKTKT